jgi:hypothetical protein
VHTSNNSLNLSFKGPSHTRDPPRSLYCFHFLLS